MRVAREQVPLVIVGEGIVPAETKAAIAELPSSARERVTLTGARRDVARVLSVHEPGPRTPVRSRARCRDPSRLFIQPRLLHLQMRSPCQTRAYQAQGLLDPLHLRGHLLDDPKLGAIGLR